MQKIFFWLYNAKIRKDIFSFTSGSSTPGAFRVVDFEDAFEVVGIISGSVGEIKKIGSVCFHLGIVFGVASGVFSCFQVIFLVTFHHPLVLLLEVARLDVVHLGHILQNLGLERSSF